MKKIVLTGGGTAGHVTPHLALLPALRAAGYEVHYIGSHVGIERDLALEAGLPYYGIAGGKLRRYASWRNVTDVFRVVKGLGDALGVLRKLRPDVVFSKGGFVTVPVMMAARMLGLASVLHESDITPGLANRLAGPFAQKICVSFPETLQHVGKKGVHTGTPVRAELLAGSPEQGLALCNWSSAGGLPVLLVTGGSTGAAAINACVREALPELLPRFRVIHLCGRGNLWGQARPGYAEFEYVTDGLAHLYALADVVLSRAGANTLFELLAMRKPHVLVPLTRAASRGDQLLNAASFARQGFAAVLPEEDMTPSRLVEEVSAVYAQRERYAAAMAALSGEQGTPGIGPVMDVINGVAGGRP